ncbi:hypothetical protein PoB_007001600 [Plakobranchus ocellatus]|uniref:Secreted protein n=1 Tax=Plakobranchus ocellatus TaxID=259542 RepID=A0AAV4DH92_9GAST|nr:hypothetical protein PoB_007001600 [Plakobranchus ocellatus]
MCRLWAVVGFFNTASSQPGDLGISGPRQARAPVAGLEPATERSLQISGRTRQPLCHRRLRWWALQFVEDSYQKILPLSLSQKLNCVPHYEACW